MNSYLPYGYLYANAYALLSCFNGELLSMPLQAYGLGNGHRFYAPALMRFLSADPLSPFEKGGTNTYAYCSNDSVNYLDPTGGSRKFLAYSAKRYSAKNRQAPTSRVAVSSWPELLQQRPILESVSQHLSSQEINNLITVHPGIKADMAELSIKRATPESTTPIFNRGADEFTEIALSNYFAQNHLTREEFTQLLTRRTAALRAGYDYGMKDYEKFLARARLKRPDQKIVKTVYNQVRDLWSTKRQVGSSLQNR